MENQVQTSLFYKARGFSGRLSEGFKFVTDNLSVLLKSSLFVVLPVSVLLAVCMVYTDNLAGITAEEIQSNPVSMVCILPLLLVSIVGGILFYALAMSYVQMQAEKGVLPMYKTKQWMKLMFCNTPKMIGYFLTIMAVLLILSGILLALIVLTKTLYILLFYYLAIMVVMVPLMLMPYIQVLEKKPYFPSLVKSFKIGFVHWGSTFGIMLLTFILAGIVQFIASLPMLITLAVDYAAKTGFIEGNGGLPGYYLALKFVLVLISAVLSYWSAYIVIGPMAYQYSAIAAMREREKSIDSNDD